MLYKMKGRGKAPTSSKKINVLIYGDPEVSKNIIKKFLDDESLKGEKFQQNFTTFKYELFLDNRTIKYNLNICLNVLKPKENFPYFLKNSDGAILTFDFKSEQSFEFIKDIFKKKSFDNFYITLLGDNYGNRSDFEVVPNEAKKLVKDTRINYCDLSAKSNLKESIENVLKEIYNFAMNVKDNENNENCCNCTHRRCDIF